MALPSARRPRLAQELLNEEVNKIKKDIKVKLNLGAIIISTVGSWYETKYAKNPKAQLTAKKLKRCVYHHCHKFKFEYCNLPSDWLDQLKKEYGLVIHEKKCKIKKEENCAVAFMADEHGNGLKEEVKLLNLLYRTTSDDSLFSEEDGVKNLSATSTSGFLPSTSEPVRETRQSLKRRNCEKNEIKTEPMDLKVEADYTNPKPEKKRLIDLSGEPPPTEWLTALAKGVALPRVLRVHSTADMNVIFYDYKPFPEEAPSGYTPRAVHGVGFQWWADFMSKKSGYYKGTYVPLLLHDK